MDTTLSPTAFQTATLRRLPGGDAVTRILAAAIQAVEPATAVHRHMQRDGTTLTIGTNHYHLDDYERVVVVGAGKAGAAMFQAAAQILGDYLTDATVIVKDDSSTAPPATSPTLLPLAQYLCVARHPLPDERGVAATQRIAALLEQTTERDLVLVLLSGGGSALLTLPAPGLTLDDMQALTSELLACGAAIHEINSLRKHLDLVKGGGLARMAAPAAVITLILSDVVGNPLDVIASGPTVPDRSTFADAYGVLESYNLVERVPPVIVQRLQAGVRGEVAETPAAGDAVFARTQHVLVGSNEQAITGALVAARAEGFHARVITLYSPIAGDASAFSVWKRVPEPGDARICFGGFQGEARLVGQRLAGIARAVVTPSSAAHALYHLPRPLCLVLGGETTVTLCGSGHGGRNQEVALAAVREMDGLSDVALVTLATDGGDGPTDAAGAVVTGTTLERAQEVQRDPDMALADNDAYPFFAALGDLLRPGATGTNVNDLVFVFAW